MSAGATLFRKVFTLTQAECDAFNGGYARFDYDVVADDWWAMYINGHQIARTTETSSQESDYRETAYVSNVFNCSGSRENVVAIQATDKAAWASGNNSAANAAGLRYVIRFSSSTPPSNWRLQPGISGNVTTATPGETITWTHTVRNTATAAKDAVNVPTQYRPRHSTNGPSGPFNNVGSTSYPVGSLTASAQLTQTSTYVVQPGDVGRNICRHTYVTRQAWDNTAGLASGHHCVMIESGLDYTLVPTITRPATPGGLVEPGQPLAPEGTITNLPPSTTGSAPFEWRLSRIDYNQGTNHPLTGGTSNGGPCSFFPTAGRMTAPASANGINGCNDNIPGGRGDQSTGIPLNHTLNALADEITIGNYPLGYKICFALSVLPHSSASPSGEWRHSNAVCVTIGKKPKVQVHGGSLMVGRAFPASGTPVASSLAASRIDTSLTRITGNADPSLDGTYGSWGEYGLFATGTIASMGSDSSLNPRSSSGFAQDQRALTFGNTPSSLPGGGTIDSGHYPYGKSDMPNVKGLFSSSAGIITNLGATSTTPQDIAGVTGTARGNRIVDYTGPAADVISINGGTGSTLELGQWGVLLVPEHSVEITGNLHYASGSGLTSVGDIPQLVIIAKNITIRAGVTNVDAWLIAENISTCEQQEVGTGLAAWLSTTTPNNNYLSSDARLSASHCNQPLTVNGPVMANKLFLRRTAGAGIGGAAGDPAEVFNLRPDAYLWLSHRSATYSALRSGVMREIAPRY